MGPHDAGWRVTPRTARRLEHIHLYVDVSTRTGLAEVARAAGWQQAPGGRITLMRPWYADAVWMEAREVRGVTVVNPLQLMLDLWHYPVRGREAAEYIADVLLSWKPHAAV